MDKKKKKIVSKQVLIDRISDEWRRQSTYVPTKQHMNSLVSAFLIEINLALIKGEQVRFPGHFTFRVDTQKPRVARNLQTKKPMNIPAKKVPKVKFSSILRKRVAKGK